MKNFVKNKLGRIHFSDTCVNREGKAAQIIPKWDVEREIKHRVWHNFWDMILCNKCGEEVALRMFELKEDTQNYGFEKIKKHWEGAANPLYLFTRRMAH